MLKTLKITIPFMIQTSKDQDDFLLDEEDEDEENKF